MTHDRRQLARLSLDGLSIGDAFGQCFFTPGVFETTRPERPPAPPWRYTDDTEMAIGLVQVLETCQGVDQDVLAKAFADRHAAEPYRGYGAGARQLLTAIARGADWRTESAAMFSGTGSCGNGAAMRVAPLGAWFADDDTMVVVQAEASAKVTHSPPEGVAGAIAVALAACWATRWRAGGGRESTTEMIPWILERISPSEVKNRLEWAATYDFETWPYTVAEQVGSGGQVTAQDTVPRCV